MIARHSFQGILPTTLLWLADSVQLTSAEPYSIDGRANTLDSARMLAFDLMRFYNGNETGKVPGLLDDEYYFWQSAALWETMIAYWHHTGDETFNDLVTPAVLHQAAPSGDFMSVNQSMSLSNDDQCNWALAALSAAESGFHDTPAGEPDWVTLAQNVFEQQALRFDLEAGGSCNGGLRWSILDFNVGFDFKNTASNGCFLNLGARLARFTGNATYAEYAERAWDWLSDTELIDSETWGVYDGAHTENNCTQPVRFQWSSNAAFLAQGSAFMYNYTDGSDTWKERVEKLTEAMITDFFPNGTIFELPCEGRIGTCPSDAQIFKGAAHRRLSNTAQLAPFTSDRILPALASSARSAINQCTGGGNGRQCGFYWEGGQFIDPARDDTTGAGGQMSVLSAVISVLDAEPPLLASSERPSDGSRDDHDPDNAAEGEDDDSDDSSHDSADAPNGGSMAALAEVSTMAALATLGCWTLLSI